MKNRSARYYIKYAEHINREIARAKVELGDKAEKLVYGAFEEAVTDYLSTEKPICTDEEFLGFFRKYVGFAITSNRMTRAVVSESNEDENDTPWYLKHLNTKGGM